MYGYNLLTWVCQDLSRYFGTWNLKVLSSDITHKKDAPEDKDLAEAKELSNPSGPYLSKIIPPIVIVITSCNADVTMVPAETS